MYTLSPFPYYEHKALCMCAYETLHTHVLQHYRCRGNIPYSLPIATSLRTLPYPFTMSIKHYMYVTLHTHVVEHHHCRGKISYS